LFSNKIEFLELTIKYKNMFFRQIPGKKFLKNFLTLSVERNQIPHAQIFLGAEGYGGLPMALAFVSYIMCENKRDGDSCGTCSQCLKTHKYIHPDVHFSFPAVNIKGSTKRQDVTSNNFLPEWRKMLGSQPYMGISDWLEEVSTDTSQPNINVKECNEIIQKLSMMTYESPYKILIMWLPEYLGKEGNRLLKIIEEPTDNTFIILVSENQEHILQTILSRCRITKIPAFEPDEIKSYLIDNEKLDERAAAEWSNLAEGSLNRALKYAKNADKGFSSLLIEWLRTAYKTNIIEVNDIVGKITSLSKDEQRNFYTYGLHFIRQVMYMQLTKSQNVQLTPDEVEIAQKMSSILDPEKIEAVSEVLNEAIDNVARNVNMKIALFSDTLEIGAILKGQMKREMVY